MDGRLHLESEHGARPLGCHHTLGLPNGKCLFLAHFKVNSTHDVHEITREGQNGLKRAKKQARSLFFFQKTVRKITQLAEL